MRWPDDLTGWPMSEYSRRVLCRPHNWHVQEAGTNDLVLLLHGAGGATQSWRGVFPRLAETHRVIAIDLPGQGFTELGARQRCGLPYMADDIARLLEQEGWAPRAIIGHSAGVAIALWLSLLGRTQHVIGINAALSNFQGLAGWLFPIMAKALSLNPLTSRLFTATSNASSVRGLLKSTGSAIDETGEALYLRLIKDRQHVDATLSMMAQWSLDRLTADFANVTARVDLIIAENDQTVPPQASRDAAERLPNAEIYALPNLGHLAHEEDPAGLTHLIRACLNQAA